MRNHGGAEKGLSQQLQVRLDQQEVVAQLGLRALSGISREQVLDEAAGKVAETLGVEYCGIMELQEGREELLLRAGIGWKAGIVGSATVAGASGSQAGYTMSLGEPVVVTDLSAEERFRPPPLLLEHRVRSGVTVVINRPSGMFGVLGAYTTQQRTFERHDLHFLQAVANIIGEAVERRQAEEVQAQLAAIVESSYDAVFRKTLDGIITSWNAAAQRMYGYSPSEVIGKKVTILFPPELEQTFEEIMDKVFRWHEPVVWETVRVHKDGLRIPISLTVSPILDRQGNVVAASTIAHDISDRVRAEETLRQAKQDLEIRVAERTAELNDVITELEAFSYAVSHDLRAPLRAISGFTTALKEDYGEELNPEAKRLLGRIVAAAERMQTLIGDLLDLSRVGFQPLQMQPVDLSEIARDAARDLSEQRAGRRVEFEIESSIRAEGDPHLLSIVLVNLIENACKFSSEREDARVVVGSRQQGDETVYYVADNGIGFDMKHAEQLFKPFQRLHGPRVEGTGIGLATVQRIIRRHGGRVWAESEVGEGATFYFTLNVAPKGSPS